MMVVLLGLAPRPPCWQPSPAACTAPLTVWPPVEIGSPHGIWKPSTCCAPVPNAESVLKAALPAGANWVVQNHERPGVWLVYMGKYANREALDKKLAELKDSAPAPSLSRIVSTAVEGSPSAVPSDGSDSFRRRTSAGSGDTSLLIGTRKDRVATPGAKLSRPELAP